MTVEARVLEGTQLVELYDGDKPVAGPFTADEAAAWIEAQQPTPRTEAEPEQEPESLEPRGIL